MNAPAAVRHPDPVENEASIIDQIVRCAIAMVLLAARSKAAALCALLRIGGEELAKLEGHEEAAIHHAKWARIHHERGVNALRVRR